MNKKDNFKLTKIFKEIELEEEGKKKEKRHEYIMGTILIIIVVGIVAFMYLIISKLSEIYLSLSDDAKIVWVLAVILLFIFERHYIKRLFYSGY